MLPEFRIVPVGLTQWKVEIKTGESYRYKDGGWCFQKEVIIEEVWETAYKTPNGTHLIAAGARPSKVVRNWNDRPYYNPRDLEDIEAARVKFDRYEQCLYNSEQECEKVIDTYLNILKAAHDKEEAIKHRLATVKPRRYP